jgi:hypothetical protein
MSKPTEALGTLAMHFNERLQTDLFTQWNRQYIIFLDECIRWTLCSHLLSKSSDDWLKVFVTDWCGYFGPPKILFSDQEGPVISDLLSRACEAYGIDRDLSGSEGHTRTGVAERKIGFVKLGALKQWHQTQKQDLRLPQDERVIGAARATNSVLVYNTALPNQAFLK